ncbi:hypothetical protein LPJ73_001561 [Coemansia sp. RSA 2703]|nr:hypothetical protein LPJ73_001561 [Coemansia sp. RSA 2703]KAJ2386616.1 hypothetical protein GGI05_004332 [Coemansia sp. RSA 2603]
MQQKQVAIDSSIRGNNPSIFVPSKFYKIAHGASGSDQDSNEKVYYYAAAQDDKQGWNAKTNYIDPMYTMRRREKEGNEASKESFFKRLKTRLDQKTESDDLPTAQTLEQEPKPASLGSQKMDVEDDKPSSSNQKTAFSSMRFGFGMGMPQPRN